MNNEITDKIAEGSNSEESFKEHGLRVYGMIYRKNLFVHGSDKACNAHMSVLIVLSECEGMAYPEARSMCLGYTGLSMRTIGDKIRGFKAIGILLPGDAVLFSPLYARRIRKDIL